MITHHMPDGFVDHEDVGVRVTNSGRKRTAAELNE